MWPTPTSLQSDENDVFNGPLAESIGSGADSDTDLAKSECEDSGSDHLPIRVANDHWQYIGKMVNRVIITIPSPGGLRIPIIIMYVHVICAPKI